MVLINVVVYKLKKLNETRLDDDKSNNNNKLKRLSLSTEHSCRQFTFAEMQLATNDFDESMIIGKGGFGKVYKGIIDRVGVTMTVAIKRLDSKSKQGVDEFCTEISMLSKFRHSHLVSLFGYCNEGDEMMVVYEYVSGGNLAERLHKKACKYDQGQPLSWVERLRICIGAARALDYLHTGTGTRHRIIHRDVKSSNILLDDDKAAKLSDFGVSKIGPVDQACTHVSTDVKGSFGYFDPNYFMTRRLTRKSDVYSFGVVLLEVLCGRPAVDPTLGDNELGLVGWAQRSIKEGRLNKIIDPSLMGSCFRVMGQIMPKCLTAFVEICVKCLQGHPNERPTMAEVVVALETALALQHRGELFVVHKEEGVKSGKLLTFSRMLRNMLPVKTPVRSPEPFEKKERPKKWVLSGIHSNRDGKGEDTLKEAKVVDSSLKIFSLDGLKNATRNFSDDNVLGEGAFGKVFKGWVERETYVPSKVGSGIPVAVKKLDPDGLHGLEEWKAEVEFLGKLSHPNLVKLLGYCSQDDDLCLVYEFMPKGSLDDYILKQGLVKTLSWSMRVKVMVGIAKAIAFLHSTENQIIFRDLKTSNILLDQV
ncbi:probable serine/threonine-protein kinase PBL7 [Rutidosis leptorrhynchoides]|uniref:probable serine/threonine-protein kinase PBL7 n=1 Tax=Rutidosis leptorrhynchoides TaxID=125765 RepID=UPI003A98EEEF